MKETSYLDLVERCFYRDERDLNPISLIMDYETPVELLYGSFVKEIVENTGRLGILVFCPAECVERTWSPDWSTMLGDDAGLIATYITLSHKYDYLTELPYNSTPRSHCTAKFADF
jgi:hypothetical protein